MWREDLQVDRLPVYAFVVTCYACSLCLDLPLHFSKVVPSSARYMMELGPLPLHCDTGWRMGNVYLVVGRFVVSLARDVDELEDERSPCNNTATSG
jgi:hypothetical protein